MRVRKKNWALHELENNDMILSEAEKHKGKWKQVFKNEQPIHLEIGCGKGNFITETSLINPDINYIAIEREDQVIVSGARKMRELGAKGVCNHNIYFFVADVSMILDYFAPGEIERIYINFCDPWPNRKKWAKRRLTHKNFLSRYKEILSENGEIHFKTDNTTLFEFSLNEFSNEGWHLRNISLDLHHSDYLGNIMTEYEAKFSQKGMPIYRLEAFL